MERSTYYYDREEVARWSEAVLGTKLAELEKEAHEYKKEADELEKKIKILQKNETATRKEAAELLSYRLPALKLRTNAD